MRRWGNVTAFYSKRDFMSNHYISYFTVKGIRFNCLEQFMMYCKAMLFGDQIVADAILVCEEPQGQKMLGRKVKGYDDAVWVAKREGYILIGMIEKYSQNPQERQRLMDTGDTILVEASERDTTYGVGLNENDPRIENPYEWKGANLCGELTMKAREHFKYRAVRIQ
ncbi:hypothetical protein [Burkholderia phage FLC9]|nr:hypothetical protein [Burkholderia phage FLC9]